MKQTVVSCTFREQVQVQAHALEQWADRLDRPRYSANEVKRGRTRGTQKTLRWVARELRSLATQHLSEYGLYKALNEFSECLATTTTDASEEARELRKRERIPLEQREVEGEAHVLPRICTKLSRLLSAFAPREDRYVLSLDGKSIMSFVENENEPALVDERGLPAVLKRVRPSFRRPAHFFVVGSDSRPPWRTVPDRVS